MFQKPRFRKLAAPAIAAIASLLAFSLADATPASAQELACVSAPCTTTPVEGWIRGPEGAMYAEYEIVDGAAVFEGDIRIEELDLGARAAIGDGPIQTWSGGVIPYVIGTSIFDVATLDAAISHINANTALTLVPRTGESSYLEFLAGGGCWSYVGRRGGRQEISVAGCPFGSIVHEILHGSGVWHEQSRSDRDAHVMIQFANVDPNFVSNFNMFPSGQGLNHGAYDYGSIMHYPGLAFSTNGQPTIVPLVPGVVIGQRAGLSAGDIAGIAALYGGTAPPPPLPPGTMAPVAATKLKVKQDATAARARLVLKAVDAAIAPPAAGTTDDPAIAGGRVRIVNPNTGEQGVIELPASGWVRKANGTLRYRDASCKVTVKPTGKLKVGCKGATGGFSLDEPAQGVLGLKLELGTSSGFCAGGGLVTRDYGIGWGASPTKGVFHSIAAPPPSGCSF